MSRRSSLRDQYPALFSYGDQHKFLTTEEAELATPEERIRSIWPFLVRRILLFQARLKPREKVNFDPEDTLSELFIILMEKDAQWTPERGKYITFAGTIIDHELCAIRDKSSTVHAPRNSSCRLKEYQAEEDAGTISDRRLKTYNDIRRTSESSACVDGSDPGVFQVPCARHADPADSAVRSEAADEAGAALQAAILQLDYSEAVVIGLLSGLWGHRPQNATEIAWRTQRSPAEVRRLYSNAVSKIRDHMTAFGHPATISA